MSYKRQTVQLHVWAAKQLIYLRVEVAVGGVWRLPSGGGGGQRASNQVREPASTRIGSVSPHTVAHTQTHTRSRALAHSLNV